jgi:hypothetical protein
VCVGLTVKVLEVKETSSERFVKCMLPTPTEQGKERKNTLLQHGTAQL